MIAIAVLASGLSAGCADKPAGGDPAPVALALGLSSYTTLSELRARFGGSMTSFPVDPGFHPTPLCPPREVLHLVVPRVEQEGFVGRIELDVVNQRLYRVALLPDDPIAQITTLRARGVAFQKDGAAPATRVLVKLVPATPVAGPIEDAEARGVSWSDRKILDEMDAWFEACI